jgi:hypothetical protein
MKCAECQRYCLENACGELPEAVSAHLLDCPRCRKAHARVVSLCQLMSLKNYEQPDAAFETRLLAKVQSGIRDWEEQPRGFGERLWAIFADGQIPALRYAMAVMVVALIGLNMISVQNMPTLPSSSIEARRPEQKPAAVAAVESTNRYFNPSLPVVFLQSNAQPSGIQYGTGPSRLVGFEY